MYEPLAADSAASDHFTTASDPDDSECDEDRPDSHTAESPSADSWYVMLAALVMLASLHVCAYGMHLRASI